MEILFVLRKNQTDKTRPGTIYCRITLNGERAGDFSTYVSVSPQDWNPKAQLIDSTTDEATADNERLISTRTELKEYLNELIRAGKPVSARIIKSTYIQKKTAPVTLSKLLELHLAHKIERRLSDSTIKNVTSRRKTVVEFLQINKLLHMSTSEVDESFLDELAHYLRYKKNHKPSHVVRHLRLITETLKWAKKKKLIAVNPTEDITFENEENDRTPALTSLQIYQLETYSFASPALQRTADRFLIQVYTGFNYVDLMAFKADWDIIGHWIKKNRKKSDVTFIVPVVAKLRKLLTKYNNQPPAIANATYNRLLKEVAAVLDIKINLTTRVARRTAGQLWLDAGMSLEAVSRMLGHKSILTTQKSYVEIAEVRIERDLRQAGLWEFDEPQE